MDNLPKQVVVSLIAHPRGGRVQTIFRMHESDKEDVYKAARALGLTQNAFIRMVLVNGARAVLSEVKQ